MRLRTVLAAVGAGIASILVTAQPAYAHVGSGAEPSNYHVEVRALRPPTPGVGVQLGPGGQWVRIVNRDAGSVRVAGYAGEPFLRMSGGRIQVNRHSTVLTDNSGLASVPASPDPDAPPEWVSAGTGSSISWSDARISPEATGSGNRARTGGHRWVLRLHVDGTPVSVTGTRTWEPPPSPWPWVIVLVVAALGVGAFGWLPRWRVPAACVLTLASAAYTVHLVGSALAPQPGSAAAGWAAAIGTGVLCWAFAAVGIVSAWRRSTHTAFAIAVAGAAVAIISASDLPVLWNSQLPSTWPADIDRTLIVIAFGIGIGLAAAGIRLIRELPAGQPTSAVDDEPESQGPGPYAEGDTP